MTTVCACARQLDVSSRAYRLENALMSPFYPSLLLADCPSRGAKTKDGTAR
jgi:hypothetical protein